MKIMRTDKNRKLIYELREVWGTDRFSCGYTHTDYDKGGLRITLYEFAIDKKNATITNEEIEPIIVITDQEILEREHYLRCIVGKGKKHAT